MKKIGRTSKVIITPEAKVLRALRLKRGYSMRQAGDLVGYSSSLVSQIEHGRENAPKGERLLKFLGVYGIKPKYFAELAKNWKEEATDQDIVLALLPKLKSEHVKLLRSMAEQMARGDLLTT
jgi:transcriptional regulator with XRE-family HTH domain